MARNFLKFQRASSADETNPSAGEQPMTALVSVTVNVHGIGPELIKTPERDMVGGLSHGRYTYKVGLARLLDVFRAEKIAATFFWPSSEALRVPGLLHRCLADGHEVASNGHAFEDLSKLREADERALLHAAHETLTRLCGKPPTGFRAPGPVSVSTFRILSELGYRYDASNIDDDAPYSLSGEASLGPALPPRAPAPGLVELPWSPGLADSTHLSRPINQDRAEALMTSALDGLLGDMGWACITLTPRADRGLARAARIPIIQRLLARVRAAKAEIKTCGEVARMVAQADGSVIWNGETRT